MNELCSRFVMPALGRAEERGMCLVVVGCGADGVSLSRGHGLESKEVSPLSLQAFR